MKYQWSGIPLLTCVNRPFGGMNIIAVGVSEIFSTNYGWLDFSESKTKRRNSSIIVSVKSEENLTQSLIGS